MGLDILVSTFLLSSSTLIALLRSLTKVCRFCLDLARFEFVSWQFRHISLFQFIWPAAQNLLVFEKRSITEANTFYKAQFAANVSCQAPKRFIPITLPLIEAASLSLPCIEVRSTSFPWSEALSLLSYLSVRILLVSRTRLGTRPLAHVVWDGFLRLNTKELSIKARLLDFIHFRP